MIKYLIVDDEHISHEIIKGYCDMLPDMQLVKNCYDALEAISFLNKSNVDLIFLDLNLPKLKGFEFVKTLRNPPKIIVITAYKEFALEGYELNVSDYLLKPFGFERFLKAIHKAFSRQDSQTVVVPESVAVSNRIFLQSNKKYIQIETGSIQYIEATGNYTKVFTTGEVITMREKISSLLELLPKNEFVQVHKSFAVAPKHIKSIEGNQIFIGDYIIPIGKIYKANIFQLLK